MSGYGEIRTLIYSLLVGMKNGTTSEENIKLLYDSGILLLGIYPPKWKPVFKQKLVYKCSDSYSK